jgi:CubicO group peptidase (beta-lactamase class C family)
VQNITGIGTTLAAAIAVATPAQAIPADFKAKADAFLASAYPADGPGASIVVSDHGKIVYAATRGLADIEKKTPITPETVFRIGSITKQFSAAVLLQLVAEGRVALDDPLSKFFPDYPGAAGITVRHLLTHTSGIASYTALPGFMASEANTNRAYTTEQLMALVRDVPAEAKPGAEHSYNNSGYILVGALIEKITGKPWHVAVEERIAAPLGLSTIRYGVGEATVPRMATGYSEDDGKIAPSRKIHMSVPGAAGALLGTPSDLARWANALHHGKVVPASLYAQMISATKMPDGSFVPYGFGMQVKSLRGSPAIGHGGGIFGFSTNSVYLPEQDLFVAVYTNSDSPKTSPGFAMQKLAALAIGKPFPDFKPVAFDAKAAAPFLGEYRFAKMSRILALEDGKLAYRRPDGPTSELIPVGDGRYSFGEQTLTWLELKRDAKGARLLKVYPDGESEDDIGVWSGPVPPEAAAVAIPQETLARYAGHYTAPVGKVVIAAAAAGGLTIQLSGQPALALKAIAADRFEVQRVGAKVRFVESAGKVTGLEIEQGGRKLPATRD